MPEIGKILKDEISRLSRKEIRKTTKALRDAIGPLRQAAIDMKRRLGEIERIVAQLESEADARRRKALAPKPDELKSARFTSRNIKKLRKRLSLSQHDFGTLAGVAVGTVYLWEKGKASPRGRTKARLIELRKIGVREAKKRLAGKQPAKKVAAPKKKKTAKK
ncbi:MAG: helix-turn-helix domain-containing protein [Planctomycetota bacterium]|jgi:DNA-binding transcriptional regulator YiaG